MWKKKKKTPLWKAYLHQPSPENPEEALKRKIEQRFEEGHEKSVELQQKIEEIEVAISRVRERYEQYEEILGFIEYLRATEKIFVQARENKWDAGTLKEKLIESDIEALSRRLHLEKDIFYAIYRDFQQCRNDIHAVYEVANELLEKYKDCSYCKQFIEYIRDVYLTFIHITEAQRPLYEAHDRIIKARMAVLASQGAVDLAQLELRQLKDKGSQGEEKTPL